MKKTVAKLRYAAYVIAPAGVLIIRPPEIGTGTL